MFGTGQGLIKFSIEVSTFCLKFPSISNVHGIWTTVVCVGSFL